ncbi:MAG: RsmB/NOP family class I SAM-dependent RNA methyltransferase [Verrucomicrobiota bacterium]
MSFAANQARTFLRLVATLRARWHTDQALPAAIQKLLSSEKAFGSRDRRLYRELIYTTIRHLPWIEPLLDAQPEEALRRIAWLAADTPATHAFRAEFATGTPPEGDKAELLPAWFRAHCPELFSPPELATQLRRAPLWLRLQTDRPEAVLAEFETRGWRTRPSPLLPAALEVLDEADVTQSEAWTRGAIEVQDLGSQLLLESIGIAPGGRWLDACAGAGGKSLQLGRLLGPKGTVEAYDIRPSALTELQHRAIRARIQNIRTLPPSTTIAAGAYDGILVDAPCSGSGTWRRSPHLKWATTPAVIAERAALQASLLAQFSAAVRPGGRLVYATCSLSSEENESVVAAFLKAHPDFAPASFARTFDAIPRDAGLLFLPSRHDTDGFYVASLLRH